MYQARRQDDVIIIRCEDELPREELAEVAAVAR